jgi:hypothetical protein
MRAALSSHPVPGSEDVMKMKGQLNVKTPAEYIAAVDDKRRSDIAGLDALIRKHAPKLESVIKETAEMGLVA